MVFRDGDAATLVDVASHRTMSRTKSQPHRKSDLSDMVRRVPRMTATEIARNFSAILNRVAAGETVEVVRNGAPVAVIGPPASRFLPAERFRELIAAAPVADEGFAADVRDVRSAIEPLDDPWPS
jgi:prevent-host-death family protein